MLKPNFNHCKVLIIDNHDSFTYNLVYYLNELGAQTLVINDLDLNLSDFEQNYLNLSSLKALHITHILLSPGPGTPEQATYNNLTLSNLAGKLPILGVCLGHQCLAIFAGAAVAPSVQLMHGMTSLVSLSTKAINEPIFRSIPSQFTVCRYHSLLINQESVKNSELELLALAGEQDINNSAIMAIKHKKHKNLYGVQFHPEAILTEYGHQLLINFLALV